MSEVKGELFKRKDLAVCNEPMPEEFRVAGGKLVEHWATRDDLAAMLQLGVLRPPGRLPNTLWNSVIRVETATCSAGFCLVSGR
jgi:hypothetical protein